MALLIWPAAAKVVGSRSSIHAYPARPHSIDVSTYVCLHRGYPLPCPLQQVHRPRPSASPLQQLHHPRPHPRPCPYPCLRPYPGAALPVTAKRLSGACWGSSMLPILSWTTSSRDLFLHTTGVGPRHDWARLGRTSSTLRRCLIGCGRVRPTEVADGPQGPMAQRGAPGLDRAHPAPLVLPPPPPPPRTGEESRSRSRPRAGRPE